MNYANTHMPAHSTPHDVVSVHTQSPRTDGGKHEF